jgi:DUF4097 and DUF4098 domain-containing protein YvlB
MTFRNALIGTLIVGASAVMAPVAAQQASPNDPWCQDGENWGRDRAGYCEVREFTLPATGAPLAVDASPNGGIQVEGGTRADVRVRAKVVATAANEARARAIVQGVRISPAADRIHAESPGNLESRESWSVSYRIEAPTQTSLDLKTVNGGISISGVESRVQFQTTNGGVKLRDVGGDVKGRTTNGGVDVSLDGGSWQGEGLDVETSNGGVKVSIPEHYSAEIEIGTVNGGFRTDLPLNVQGRLDREIKATLGGGGAPIRIKTRNGGVNLTKKQ